MDGWTDGWMDGWMDRQMNGWMCCQAVLCSLCPVQGWSTTRSTCTTAASRAVCVTGRGWRSGRTGSTTRGCIAADSATAWADSRGRMDTVTSVSSRCPILFSSFPLLCFLFSSASSGCVFLARCSPSAFLVHSFRVQVHCDRCCCSLCVSVASTAAQDDKRCGNGVFRFSDGSEWVGVFRDNERYFGTYTWPVNKRKYSYHVVQTLCGCVCVKECVLSRHHTWSHFLVLFLWYCRCHHPHHHHHIITSQHHHITIILIISHHHIIITTSHHTRVSQRVLGPQPPPRTGDVLVAGRDRLRGGVGERHEVTHGSPMAILWCDV